MAMDATLLSLARLAHELAEEPDAPLSLADALAVRDARSADVAIAAETAADADKAHREAERHANNLENLSPLLAKVKGIKPAAKAKAHELAAKYAVERQRAHAVHQQTVYALEAAHRSVELAATVEYEALLKDKRVGVDNIACSRWYADENPEGVEMRPIPRCHCLEVPGNTWPDGSEPPHHAGNYQGKPWCVACQSWECDGPHPAVTLEAFLRRFKLEPA